MTIVFKALPRRSLYSKPVAALLQAPKPANNPPPAAEAAPPIVRTKKAGRPAVKTDPRSIKAKLRMAAKRKAPK